MTTLLLIGFGGFVGANVRFAIAAWSMRRSGSDVPLGTLVANLSGSFLIGMIIGMIDDPEARLLLATGFLGAETTFSTFAVETLDLAERGGRGMAVVNIALNVAGALIAVLAGLALAWLLREMR